MKKVVKVVKKVGGGIKRVTKTVIKKTETIVEDVLYNADRTIASLAGAPPQETISSEIGRHESDPVDKIAAEILDDIQKDHVENAIIHADLLDAVDNGQEQ